MDEDGPNFSYAYGGTSTPSAPSWNPALRPDHMEEDASRSTKQIQPSPEIVPQSKPVLEDNQEEGEDELPVGPAVSGGPPQVSKPSSDRGSDSGNNFFDDLASGNNPQNSRHMLDNRTNGHGVNTPVEDGLVSTTQALNLDEPEERADRHMNSTLVAPQAVNRGGAGADTGTSEEQPVERYEHQGASTALEDAVAESAKAPLVADAEPATDDWDASGEVFDLGGKPQDAPVAAPSDALLTTPHVEAGGTTVGDAVIGNTKVGGNTGDGIDWGNSEGDEFFGAGAVLQSTEPQQSTEEGPGAHVVNDSSTKTVTNTESTWDIALDDDFLPDTDETPVFELDDDEGFLEEDTTAAAPQQPAQATPALPSGTVNGYAPQVPQTTQPTIPLYGRHGPQLAQTRPAATQSLSFGAYGQPPRPQLPSSAESFVDKSKGGYHSPYDLPDDVVAPIRKKPTHRTSSIPSTHPTPPPPKSSSMYSDPSVHRPPPPSNMSASSLSPPSSSHSMQAQMSGLPSAAPPKPSAKAPSNDFFAELPITSKPKHSARYTPHQGSPQQHPSHGFPPKERTASWSSLRNEILPDSDNLIAQLRQPECLPVFPDQPSAPLRSNSLPVPHPPPASSAPPSSRYSPAPPSAPITNTRYSPAPPPVGPSVSSRYSPAPPQASVQNHHSAPPPTGPPRPPQPYAPRTSSPLAYHAVPQHQESAAGSSGESAQHGSNHYNMHSSESIPRAPFKSPLEGVSEAEEQGAAAPSGPPIAARSETPPLRSGPSSAVSSPRKRANYMPQQHAAPAPPLPSMPPPPRAQSASPSASMKHAPRTVSYNERPTTGHSYTSPPSAFGTQPTPQNVDTIPHRRQASLDYECIAPNDERAADPLQRWKGAPIFTWGLGGTVVTTFPKQIPRYGGGASVPMMKCSPGDIKIQSAKEVLPMSEDITKFPGPLKGKSKKKDVSAWLVRRIDTLDAQLKTPGLDYTMSHESLIRLKEKALLWKIMQVFIDNDGHLEGNSTVESAVRKVLSPEEVDTPIGESATFATAADLVSLARSNTSAVQAEPVDPRAVEELRNLLTKGDREKAVWHAVDQRLWAHAMLLSSTLNKDIWKQVVQEFVQKEVKKIGRNNQALAVLYEIFAGNHEDCIDELVPASARAGFQMMSTDGAGPAQNALQGLDKWRETLSLVLSNRSEGDAAALLSLGKLLAGYGRTEAAHICFLFARSTAYIGGVDDQLSDIVLVGADHRQNPLELGVDLEPILLTEVYEFGLSLSAQSGSHIIPHLQNYKLGHAYQLAEHGYKSEAQAYCDAIAGAMKATTRISPYYNGSFVASLDDLSKRLSQSPKDGSSWISKPSMDKVSSSLLSKFNSFIAGDDEDTASNHSGGAEAGPFAKIAGNTPTLSPAQSGVDLYGAYSGFGVPSAPPATVNSRYAPSNSFTPRTSLEQTRSKYEPQGRPSLESTDGSAGMRAVSDSYIPSPNLSGPYTPTQPQLSPPSQHSSKMHSYSPLRAEHSASELAYGTPYQPTPPVEEPPPAFGGYQPQANFDTPPADSSQSSGGYEPPTSSYAPPTSSYEPPSYQPYEPDADDKSSEEEPKSKKKSFMDDEDDDDLASRAAALKSKQKSEADRQADEAFRKAAEADAKRDKEAAAAKKSGGWFGGWFKKDPNAAPGPIKAKLGEENSFYYDPELKKWVNKKAGGTEATKPIATPPPPKSGPPSRSVSNTSTPGGPPSSLPNASHLSAPPSRPPTSNPTRSSSMPPPMGMPGSRASTPGIPSDSEGGRAPPLMPPVLPAGSGPPSRPGTGMSNASSIDDLLGAPQARKGAAGKKKKAGRYVDVMAK